MKKTNLTSFVIKAMLGLSFLVGGGYYCICSG